MPKMANGPKKTRVNAAIQTENATGTRWCIKCNKLIPLDQFRTNKRTYLCTEHFRDMKRQDTLGTREKRAFNSLRCKARADMMLFGMSHMVLPRASVVGMLTDDQITNFSKVTIIPRRPDQPLTKENSIVVTSIQRIYVVAKWRSARDPDQYEHDLQFVLSEISEPTKKKS
jgi:hypothetical protein